MLVNSATFTIYLLMLSFIFPSFSSNPSIHVSSSVNAALTQVFTFSIFSSKSGPSISFIATIDFFISSTESLMFSKQSATACPSLVLKSRPFDNPRTTFDVDFALFKLSVSAALASAIGFFRIFAT
ncbi:hypothetical protein HanIR_Chr14g0726121 [Helianthus annuus]|nr:hypothetical protein HanIR_Chr14g0726121 [Helianthus annuus]